MAPKGNYLAIAFCTGLLFLTGCATTPFAQQGETAERSLVVDLTRYFGYSEERSRVYLRTNLKDPKDVPVLYERRDDTNQRAEGRLCSVRSKPIASYLAPPKIKNHVVRFPWPDKKKPVGPAFFIEFDPPVAEWPERLTGSDDALVNANMNVYDRAGNLFARGTAARRVRLEGYEIIEVGGIVFPDCLRLSSEISFHFGWWATFRLSEQMWVTPDAGLLRRTERVHGMALLMFRFDSLYQYELVSGSDSQQLVKAEISPSENRIPKKQSHNEPSHEKLQHETLLRENALEKEISQSASHVHSLPHWTRLAIYLDRDVPRPRVGGLLIEYDNAPQH